MSTYSLAELMQLTGASRSQMTHWTKQGVIRADIEEAAGPGHHRRFSFFNVIQAHIVFHLQNLGISIPVIRWTMDYLRFFEAAAGTPGHEIAAILRIELRKAMREAGKQRRASRVRIAEVRDELLDEHIADAKKWRQIRRPGPERDSLAYYGLRFTYGSSGAGVPAGVLPPRLVAIPKVVIPESEVVVPGFRPLAAVLFSLEGIPDLEAASGDSLPTLSSEVRTGVL